MSPAIGVLSTPRNTRPLIAPRARRPDGTCLLYWDARRGMKEPSSPGSCKRTRPPCLRPRQLPYRFLLPTVSCYQKLTAGVSSTNIPSIPAHHGLRPLGLGVRRTAAWHLVSPPKLDVCTYANLMGTHWLRAAGYGSVGEALRLCSGKAGCSVAHPQPHVLRPRCPGSPATSERHHGLDLLEGKNRIGPAGQHGSMGTWDICLGNGSLPLLQLHSIRAIPGRHGRTPQRRAARCLSCRDGDGWADGTEPVEPPMDGIHPCAMPPLSTPSLPRSLASYINHAVARAKAGGPGALGWQIGCLPRC